jgi:hypothetical protein
MGPPPRSGGLTFARVGHEAVGRIYRHRSRVKHSEISIAGSSAMRESTLRVALASSILGILLSPSFAAGQGGGNRGTEEQPCGLVYGKSDAFWVCAPKGWELDNTVLKDQGIFATFYPAGSSWEKARDNGTFMYVNTVGKREGTANVVDLMKDDWERTTKASPRAQIRELKPIKTPDGEARVQQFEHSAFGRFEAVAYIDAPKTLVMIIITSKDEQSYRRDYPAFKELVQSYKFWTTEVTIHTK